MTTKELLRVGCLSGPLLVSLDLLEQLAKTPLPIGVRPAPLFNQTIAEVLALRVTDDRLVADIEPDVEGPITPVVCDGVDLSTGEEIGLRLMCLTPNPDPMPGAGGVPL